MTNAELNEAIYEAGRQVRYAITEEVRHSAVDHLETLREVQRRRAVNSLSEQYTIHTVDTLALKDTIDCQDQQLKEAQEAAARADAKAEELYAELQVAKTSADKRAKKVRQQEQTIQTLENTISRLEDDQLKEAQEADARADAKAEELYAKLVEVNSWAEKRAKKLRQQEQTIQTLENALSREQDTAARLRGELNEANSANAKLREKSAAALIQRMRDDMAQGEKLTSHITFAQLRAALKTYEREFS